MSGFSIHENRADEGLLPYASREATSRGRRYPEAGPGYRGEYERDRDRIVHCTAFRRLVYKTQVFVNHEGDLYRTRLTHSLEVAQIGRSVARRLRLNEPLAEAICLAHDLGHTPFGHAGQDALNACMRDYGGFEHNLQSLRVVDELEERYAEFPGLNLTFECREGILKHCSARNAATLGELGRRFLEDALPPAKAPWSPPSHVPLALLFALVSLPGFAVKQAINWRQMRTAFGELARHDVEVSRRARKAATKRA